MSQRRKSKPRLASLAPIGLLAITCVCACRTAGIERAFMALDAQGDRKRTTFFADTGDIFCDVQYSSGRSDLTIDVRIRSTQLWDDAVGDLVPNDEVLAQGEIAGMVGTGTVGSFEWNLSMTSDAGSVVVPYPVGDFACEVYLDGQLEATLPFTIRFPECPVPPVADGAVCEGWVQSGSVCPDVIGKPCQCTGGVWQC